MIRKPDEGLMPPAGSPLQACDLVLKGGVASGLVYAGLLRRLSEVYGFRGVAGASAGAMAAALAAAAELGRQNPEQTGNSLSFLRLSELSLDLAQDFKNYLKPSKPFTRLMQAVVHIAPGSDRPRMGQALLCLSPPFGLGAASAMVIIWLIYGLMGIWSHADALFVMLPGLVLGGVTGGLIGFLGYIVWLINLACRDYNFGIINGHAETGEGITDWLHRAMQDLSGRGEAVLCFKDLWGTVDAASGRLIDLRVVTCNLSLCRLEILPELSQPLWFDPKAWTRLFPASVMACLRAMQDDAEAPLWRLPSRGDMPVLVAVRMSLACPGLFEQVPVFGAPHLTSENHLRHFMSDGGVSLNFPFDMFDADHPERPTFAIDLDTLHDETRDSPYDTLHARLARGPLSHARLSGPFSFIWALFHAMREARLRTDMLHPSQTDRIFTLRLKRSEGGMNLDMKTKAADTLIEKGRMMADHIRAHFDFEAHRQRRADYKNRKERP